MEDWPLATMDYQTLQSSHVHPTNIFRQRDDFVGQTVSINYSTEQKWYYLSHQTPDEVTLIKIWDNKEDVAKCMDRKNYLNVSELIVKVCAHCAFQSPTGKNAKVPRESIEVRALVFYDTQ